MSTLAIRPAPIRKTLLVKADQAKTFATFASSMGRWWPREHSIIGTSPQVDVIIEPRVGGRWYELGEDGSQCDWGRVLAWEPPGRLVLTWQLGSDWRYDPALVTEIELIFTALGPNRTQVQLEHRNLERYGDAAQIMKAALDSTDGWDGTLLLFVAAAEG